MSSHHPFIPKIETKGEVREAANVLFVLAVLFGTGSLLSALWRFASGDPQWFIVTGALGFGAVLCFAARAYNMYYMREMRHHPFMAKALANPTITVIGIFLTLSAAIFGLAAILIYLK